MRIATSTIYTNQSTAIDNLVAQQQQYAQELSSGKQLNQPSDNPTQIGLDLNVRNTIAQENQGQSNLQAVNSKLTTIDGALNSLGNLLQSARGIAIQGASGTLSRQQLQSLGDQMNTLLSEAAGIANTQYDGAYVFGGSANAQQPVTLQGSPPSSVAISGNAASEVQRGVNGESIEASVSLGQAFNVNAPDGSPSVFQVLMNLRNALQTAAVTDQSGASVNVAGTALAATTPINTAGILKTPLQADSAGNVAFSITSSQDTAGTVVSLPATATVAATLAAINGVSGTTGVTASFDYKQQRLILSSAGGNFQILDTPSAGATNAGNFVEALGLQNTANLQTELSTQLGQIDNVSQAALNTRTQVGATMQSLTQLGNALSQQVVNNTAIQSNIEDADIAKVSTEYSQTNTALQAAYATTAQLEQKSLFDYIT